MRMSCRLIVVAAGCLTLGLGGSVVGTVIERAQRPVARAGPRIVVTSVIVDDQATALRFYTDVLGFVKKRDIPLGEARWLTVVSKHDPDGVELLLEPAGPPFARTYQKALADQGIPLTMFGVDDLQAEYERLRGLGVVFRTPPTERGSVKIAVFEDTCGNLIQLVQE